jgi:hypothetical protein
MSRSLRTELVRAAAAQLTGVGSLLSQPPSEQVLDEEQVALVNLTGLIVGRGSRASENARWAPLFRSPHRSSIVLELGQVGGTFDTIKVYIDFCLHATAPPPGLLPGCLLTLRRVELTSSWRSGDFYCRYLPCSSMAIGGAAPDSALANALRLPALSVPGMVGQEGVRAEGGGQPQAGWETARHYPRRMLGELTTNPRGSSAVHVLVSVRKSCVQYCYVWYHILCNRLQWMEVHTECVGVCGVCVCR